MTSSIADPLHPVTPKWLVQGEVALCPCGCIGKRKKGSFVEKTLSGASNVMRQAMFGDDVSAQNGLLQRIDPRIKIVALVVLLLTAALVRNIRCSSGSASPAVSSPPLHDSPSASS